MAERISPASPGTFERAVLETLAYFEVFSYPLGPEEVFAFCSLSGIAREDVSACLRNLVAEGRVFEFEGFFQLKNEASWAAERRECNRRADGFLPVARRMARLVGCFPFVRGVFVSGSLSKHCMRPGGDIDFFIVTAPERLWVARTLLALFKKIFLLNSHKYFCINYFVDTEHLEIEEKNRFTATEVVTLLPMWGRAYCKAFFQANAWAWSQYPHFPMRPTAGVPPCSGGFFKKIFERLLSGKLGDWLDRKAMEYTVGYWRKKFREMESRSFDLAFKSRRGVSKHHPLHFQQKVLEHFERNMREIQTNPRKYLSGTR